MSQHNQSLHPYVSFCSRCEQITAHIRGICRTCDPCTAVLLAQAVLLHEFEDGRMPSARAAASTAGIIRALIPLDVLPQYDDLLTHLRSVEEIDPVL